MAKPKAQTLQQKLGFFDEDLKKPKHDEIMIWLDQNIGSIKLSRLMGLLDAATALDLSLHFRRQRRTGHYNKITMTTLL